MKNKFSKYSKSFVLLLSMPAFAQTLVYQKTDAHGAMIFSDKQTIDATALKLNAANVYSPAKQSAVLDAKKQKNTDQTFSMIAPVDQQTIQNQREVLAMVQMNNALQSGEKIAWWLDGKCYQQNNSTQMMISGLERGEHSLQARLLDSKNVTLMTTQTITFYVRLSVGSEEP